jgi:regulator of protease activity HflC (stomatin/prohibitin superfamily)
MSKVIIKTLFAVMISTAAIAKGFSYFIGGSLLLCMILLLPVLGVVSIRLVRKYCFRPQENHLGVIYRFGRFHRFVEPNEWTVLIPCIEKLHREVSLYMRTAEISLNRVELKDGLTVDLRFKVFFKTDLRLARQENFIQVLKFEGPEWSEMIKTGLEDISRNQVFLDINYEKMNVFRKSREIKCLISKQLSDRLKGFGFLVNEENGVMLVEARPNETYLDAVQKSRAATPMGQAALERLRPILDALKKMRHEDARAAVLLEMASKIVEVENLPDLVLSPLDEYASATPGPGENNRRVTDLHRQQRRSSIQDFPLAT